MKRLPQILDGIEAVCFDCYGTLVEIGDKCRPYRRLLKGLPTLKRAELRHRLMREDRATADWPAALNLHVPNDVMAQLETDIAVECASVQLRPFLDEIWRKLRSAGLKIALCSNAASPYGSVAKDCLPDAPDLAIFSYAVGAIKPEPEIYAAVSDGLGLRAAHILFTGDTMLADVDGPKNYGFQSCHIQTLEAAFANRAPDKN